MSYIPQVLCNELKEKVLFLLSELQRFQKRIVKTNPLKLSKQRRYAFGMNEIRKYTPRAKAVIVATDIERKVFENDVLPIIKLCYSYNVPVVYCGTRKELGKMINGSISVICILSFEGCYQLSQQILEETKKLKLKYEDDFIVNGDLFRACLYGFQCFDRMISNLEIRDSQGFTPLLKACVFGHFNIIRHLLSLNANPDSLNYRQESAIFLLCRIGDADCLSIVLKTCTNLNTPDFLGQSPIQLTIKLDHPKCLNLLLEHLKIDQNLKKFAILHAQRACWQVFLKRGIVFDAADLHLAIKYKKYESVATILKDCQKRDKLEILLEKDSEGDDALSLSVKSQVKSFEKRILKVLKRNK